MDVLVNCTAVFSFPFLLLLIRDFLRYNAHPTVPNNTITPTLHTKLFLCPAEPCALVLVVEVAVIVGGEAVSIVMLPVDVGLLCVLWLVLVVTDSSVCPLPYVLCTTVAVLSLATICSAPLEASEYVASLMVAASPPTVMVGPPPMARASVFAVGTAAVTV